MKMKSLLSCVLLSVLISRGFSYPRNKQFDTFNWFDDYMTDRNYDDVATQQDDNAVYDEDDKWVAGLYDREESLIPKDPNSVYPDSRKPYDYDDSDESDESVEASGWTGVDDEDDYYEENYQSDDAQDEYEDEVDYIEDEMDYVEEDVQLNEDLIYELEDDLDYDEQKIERMDHRLRKLNKSLKSLQNLVNAMETSRIEDVPRKQAYFSKDADY